MVSSEGGSMVAGKKVKCHGLKQPFCSLQAPQGPVDFWHSILRVYRRVRSRVGSTGT